MELKPNRCLLCGRDDRHHLFALTYLAGG